MEIHVPNVTTWQDPCANYLLFVKKKVRSPQKHCTNTTIHVLSQKKKLSSRPRNCIKKNGKQGENKRMGLIQISKKVVEDKRMGFFCLGHTTKGWFCMEHIQLAYLGCKIPQELVFVYSTLFSLKFSFPAWIRDNTG